MRWAWVLFCFAWSINSFASEAETISINVGESTLESFVNLLINGMKTNCGNVKEVMHQSSGTFFFLQPIIIKTQNSAYRVDSFQNQQPEFNSDGEFCGFSYCGNKTSLILSLQTARERMMGGADSGKVLQTKPNEIELHHPTGIITLFLRPTTGTTDAGQLGYNPKSDARLLDF